MLFIGKQIGIKLNQFFVKSLPDKKVIEAISDRSRLVIAACREKLRACLKQAVYPQQAKLLLTILFLKITEEVAARFVGGLALFGAQAFGFEQPAAQEPVDRPKLAVRTLPLRVGQRVVLPLLCEGADRLRRLAAYLPKPFQLHGHA